MALAVSEFQLLLAQLSEDLGAKISALVPRLAPLVRSEVLAFVTDAYPELVTPYIAAGNDLTAVWYDEQPAAAGAEPFSPEPAVVPPLEQLAISARWAVLQPDFASSLEGTATRALFTGSRDTVISNTEREGVRWARHASMNACGFCRMLATRGAVYHNQVLAQKSHDHCHCLAVPDRDGSFVPASYVEQWERDYTQARKDGASTPGQIAAAMDSAAGGRRPAASTRPAARSVRRGGGTGGGPPRRPPTVPPASGTGAGGAEPPWLQRSRAHVNGLTGRRRNSVVGYTGPDHERINKWLRRKNAKPDAWVEARVRDLDEVLAVNPLAVQTALTRTVDLSAFGLTRGEELAKVVGTMRVERGYMSTTRLPSGGATKTYKAPVRLTIIAPAGTPAAAVEDVSKFPGQGEVILGRGLGYTIVEPTYDDQLGMWRATMLINRAGGGIR